MDFYGDSAAIFLCVLTAFQLLTLKVASCVDKKSIFDTTVSVCVWNQGVDGASYDECLWTEPEMNVFILLIIVIIVVAISIPLNMFTEYILDDILRAPLYKRLNRELEYFYYGRRFMTTMQNVGSNAIKTPERVIRQLSKQISKHKCII